METIQRNNAPPHLSLWDAISIILGIIIGVGIFKTPTDIFQAVPSPIWAMGLWLLGGLLALAGALCFAELASTYPRSGGEYVYLTRAYGPLVGYLFAWAQLAVIRPAGMGAMAYVFAQFAAGLWGFEAGTVMWLALAAVVVLTLINLVGVTLGKTTQNILTIFKVLGLVGIVIAGFGWGRGEPAGPVQVHEVEPGWFALGMIFVLWTYAGWNEAAYIASEVKNPKRNIPRALILGTVGVIAIYLLINLSLWFALGNAGVETNLGVREVLAEAFPGMGGNLLTILVMISALGALNGMIFTTARIYAEFGADHRLFQPLAHWSRRLGTPLRALVVQGAISLTLIVGVELLVQGQTRLALGMDVFDKKNPPTGFEQMVLVTAAVFWMFFLLTGISLFVLRTTDPNAHRPFRVPGYPWLPLLFCLSSAYMMYGAIRYKPDLSLFSLALLAAGLPFYFWPKRKRWRPKRVEEPEPVGQV